MTNPTDNPTTAPVKGDALPKVKTLGGAITVKYHGPTNTKGSRWTATLDRGGKVRFSATVGFDYGDSANDGADNAARGALAKFTAWCNEGRAPCFASHELKGRVLIGDGIYAYVYA